MSLSKISVYVRVGHGDNVSGPLAAEFSGLFGGGSSKPPNEPEHGVQYELSVDTAKTTGLALIHQIEQRCGQSLLMRKGWESTLQYFKNVTPFKTKAEGKPFTQIAQELRNMGLPNIMDNGKGNYIWGKNTLDEIGVTEKGLVVCYTFQYRY
ncbi:MULTISPECIES: hypothetical protein [Pseudomonas]|uniref:Uncharacterized protein n=1 Tax=Pseudomonas wuhanensis TaxID=2954098 RepID=A0ABY9GZJ8_9PSED|nr:MULTISPECIES: hypothetical protein [unclassified Pseudomonas]WLI09861.1 hypothetical protein PSH65_16315 [Pseudomonas sp. FP603]WLI21249.1 hypothetical protein PSH88_14935 [Pseudomonas sp. FP607]